MRIFLHSQKAFEHKLSFCKIYNFLKMHKEVAYNTLPAYVKSAKKLHFKR